MKRGNYKLIYYLIFLLIIFIVFGKEKLKLILAGVTFVIRILADVLNLVSVTFNDGNGILTLIFSHPIIFFLVGIIFYFLPLRGKIGKWFGKICYYLCSIPVSALLNFISAKLF